MSFTSKATALYERVFTPRIVVTDLRRLYNQGEKRPYLRVGAVTGVSIVVGVLLDVFTPFQHVYLILRCFAAVGVAAGVFVGGHAVTLWLHERKRRAADPADPWVPLRFRSVFNYRNRLTIFVIGTTVCVVYATALLNRDWLYTFSYGVVFAIIYGLLVFLRKTTKELQLSALGVSAAPTDYDLLKRSRDAAAARRFKRRLKRQQRKVARVRRSRGATRAKQLQAKYDRENQQYQQGEKQHPDDGFSTVLHQVEEDTPGEKEKQQHSNEGLVSEGDNVSVSDTADEA